MINSSLGPCSQLHQPRLCMHFFTKTTLIYEFRNDINIIRSTVNQNRKKLIMKLTFHLNNRCLMLCLPIIHYCINLRNTMTNVSKYMCLLSMVNLRSSTISLVLLLRLRPICFFNYIELFLRCYILLVTCIWKYSSLLRPLFFILLIPFPIFLRLLLVI